MDRGMTSTESNASIPQSTSISSKKPIKSIPFHINAQIHSNIDLTTNNSLELKIQLQSVTKENDNLKKILVKLNREINNLKLLKIENETERLRKSTLSKESLLKTNTNKIKSQSPTPIPTTATTNTKKIPYSRSKSTSHSPAVPVPVIKQQKTLSTKGRSQSTNDVLDLPPFPTIDDIETTTNSNTSLLSTTSGLTTTELKKLLGDSKSIDPNSISYNMDTKRHKSNKMSSRSNSETAIPRTTSTATDDLSFLDMPNTDMDIDDIKIEDTLNKNNIKLTNSSTAGTVGLNNLIGLGPNISKTMFNIQDTNNSTNNNNKEITGR
ncbi:unnamed protein product [[Candida] boidinii]|nr:unnamed protein product [[Candida] boidinii]